MLLLVPALLTVWLLVALAAVALCAHARRLDEEIAECELVSVIDIRSAA
jgi:hypothetical protein